MLAVRIQHLYGIRNTFLFLWSGEFRNIYASFRCTADRVVFRHWVIWNLRTVDLNYKMKRNEKNEWHTKLGINIFNNFARYNYKKSSSKCKPEYETGVVDWKYSENIDLHSSLILNRTRWIEIATKHKK